MKELSVEEKAARYDEAIIRGSQLWESDAITRENYEYIFPEFKESDDERIRKDIIWRLKHSGLKPDRPINPHVRTTMKDALTWLEKKGGQHPKFRVGDTIKCVDLDKGIYDYTQEGCGNDIDYADEEFELVEQKSWSEEDEKVLDSILNDIKQGAIPDNDDINWLKLLKERVQLQPQTKQEWSDEDEKARLTIEFVLMKSFGVGTPLVDWLRKLKDRATGLIN